MRAFSHSSSGRRRRSFALDALALARRTQAPAFSTSSSSTSTSSGSQRRSRIGPTHLLLRHGLVAGFLPGLVFFARGVRPIGRDHPRALFFLIWFAVVFVFFSLSHSKLSPYLFPAFPAAALAARGLRDSDERGRARGLRRRLDLFGLRRSAALAIPSVRVSIAEAGVWPRLGGTVILFIGAAACFCSRRNAEQALGSLGAGWAGLYIFLAFLWPHTALARDIHALALDARSAAASVPGNASVVSYRTYVQGFPWLLQSVIPLADHTGELESDWLPPARRGEIFWSREEFWRRWRSGQPLVVVLRKRDAADFGAAAPPAIVLSEHGKNRLIANFEPGVPKETPAIR